MTWDINRDCDQRMNYAPGQVIDRFFYLHSTVSENEYGPIADIWSKVGVL